LWPNIKLTCPAEITIRDNHKQDATRNKSRGRVRCSDRFGVCLPAEERPERHRAQRDDLADPGRIGKLRPDRGRLVPELGRQVAPGLTQVVAPPQWVDLSD